jgi:hypothetical protein
MDAGADGPLQEFGRAEGLGKLLWAPAAELTKRAEESAERRVMQGALVLVVGFAVMGLGALLVAPGTETNATGVMVFGAFLVVAGFWLARSAGISGSAMVGVFENGLLLPASFEGGPDLETLSGPAVIRREEIDSIKEIKRGGERALLVLSIGRRNGVLTRQLEGANLSAQEGDALMKEFSEALVRGGYVSSGQPQNEDSPPG